MIKIHLADDCPIVTFITALDPEGHMLCQFVVPPKQMFIVLLSSDGRLCVITDFFIYTLYIYIFYIFSHNAHLTSADYSK